MPIAFIGAIFLLTVFTSIGDSYLKKAGQTKSANLAFLGFGLLVYLITGLIWFLIYKHVKFSAVGTVYGVCTALVFVVVGVFYFRESLKPSEIIGIVLAISSLILLSRFG